MALGSWLYWRIYCTESGGATALDIANIEFRDNGVDQTGAGKGTPSASSEFSGSNTADLAFDGSNTTRWTSSFSGMPQWIQYQFNSLTRVDSVLIHPRGGTGRNPRDFTIECSMDGSGWVTAHTVENEAGWLDSDKIFSFTPPNRPELGNRIMITPDFFKDLE